MPVEFRDYSKVVIQTNAQDVEKFVRRKVIEVENNAKRSMTGGGKPHVPSRPGQPPHVDTGLLRRSITHEVERDLLETRGRAGTNVIYGLFLELGTDTMEPRPWLRPALLKALEGL